MKNIFKQNRYLPEPSALSWIFVITSMIIIAAGFTLFSPNVCSAHESQDLEQAKAVIDNRTPFSFTHPKDGNKYT
jgi:hypothetical protein